MSVTADIMNLFAQRGAAAYHRECVSQAEHALQAAALAEQDSTSDELVVAALLHDLGHLLENLAERGINGCHEVIGFTWLVNHFASNVTAPIRLHVDAKRYLCTITPLYLEGLSPASRCSLALQGGLMDAYEQARFEQNPFSQDGVRLRHWGDMAKVPGLPVPALEHYQDRLRALVKPERLR